MAQVAINPKYPPLLGGKELAPVPMRLRDEGSPILNASNERLIKKVLEADRFETHYLKFENDVVSIGVENTKFRSVAQAVGRVASTLQRFTSDDIKAAKITFFSKNLQTATYRVDLEKITTEQFYPSLSSKDNLSIKAIESDAPQSAKNKLRFTWGVGPYIEHRLFNPDLPLSLETGIEVEARYQVTGGIEVSGSVRKSLLTNLTDNKRRSNSNLPRVHSDWPLYDLAGQSGHIHSLAISHVKFSTRNLLSNAYRSFGTLLRRNWSRILYKPAQFPIVGLDIHRVRKRDYDMQFKLLDYKTTVGH